MWISDLVTSESLFFFWKGRVGLYALLKSMGLGAGDEVVVPGYTCVVVPNAVIYTGGRPVYADIDPDTFNVTLETIQKVVTAKTAAIVVQSTYGLSADLDSILRFAKERNIPVIDDCTHGLGGYYKGKPNGSITDASFFSTQWSKPVSTGLGGMVVVRDPKIQSRLSAEIQDYPHASVSEDWMLALQRIVRPLADLPMLHYPLIRMYRWLTQSFGLSVGSSSGGEVQGSTMPAGFKKMAGKIQEKVMKRKIRGMQPMVLQRQKAADYYDRYFNDKVGVKTPIRPAYATHSMLRYTIRVEDNKPFFQKAKASNIPLGNWFDSPLYPIVSGLDAWHYKAGCCPNAETVCGQIVNLPTDNPLDKRSLDMLFNNENL